MATKSKNIRYSGWLKLAAGVLGCVGAVLCFWGLLDWDAFPAGVQGAQYAQSSQFRDVFYRAISAISQMDGFYQSEEHIISGGTIIQERLDDEKSFLEEQKSQNIRSVFSEYSYSGLENTSVLTEAINQRIAVISETFDKKISALRQSFIDSDLKNYRHLSFLVQNSGYLYSVFRDGELKSGSDLSLTEYEKLPVYAVLDAHGIVVNGGNITSYSPPYSFEWTDNESLLYVGVPQAVYLKDSTAYLSQHNRGLLGFWRFISGLILMVFSWGWLVYTAGRKTGDRGIHLNLADRLYLDITAAAVTAIDIMAVYTFGVLLTATDFLHPSLFIAAGIGLLLAAWGATAFFLVTLSKRLKRREVLRHTLIYFIFSLLLKPFILIRNVMSSRPFERQFSVALFLFAGCLAGSAFLSLLFAAGFGTFGGFVLFVILTVITLTVGLGYIRKNLGAVTLLAHGVGAIRGGRLDYAFPPTGSVFVDRIAHDVGNLSEGLSKAVASEVAAQKMKVELITNVSHDLKTPLTSIISYTDLLSKEKEMSKDGKKYIGIVAEKSLRLKKLIDDLFEISKAESGQISAKAERLSLEELLRQAVAEFGQRLEADDLSVKLPELEEDLFILGDSTRLWRVFSNIFGNLEKYALPHTRVYIDAEADVNTVKVTFKNISNYEMNFDPARISQRFQRGEEARTGEGSGLGLAIVGSFMELQGGRCDIAVDGDLFKLTLTFRRAQ